MRHCIFHLHDGISDFLSDSAGTARFWKPSNMNKRHIGKNYNNDAESKAKVQGNVAESTTTQKYCSVIIICYQYSMRTKTDEGGRIRYCHRDQTEQPVSELYYHLEFWLARDRSARDLLG